MQPYIFPYIGYFQLINQSDIFVSLDDVNFIKKGWINRNRIIVNKNEHTFTIPVSKTSQNKKINEHFVSIDQKWKNSFLKTIYCSYSKSPYFKSVFSLIEKCLSFEDLNCASFIENTIKECCLFIGINTPITKSSKLIKNEMLVGEERIIEICKMNKASSYINPIGGQNLYSKESFEQEDINLNFIKSDLTFKYPQKSNEFLAGLSIIDLLMNLSTEKVYLLINTKFEIS